MRWLSVPNKHQMLQRIHDGPRQSLASSDSDVDLSSNDGILLA
jgi:hypothetical protein